MIVQKDFRQTYKACVALPCILHPEEKAFRSKLLELGIKISKRIIQKYLLEDHHKKSGQSKGSPIL